MIRKIRRILAGLLVLVLCVPMNTVFAEEINEHANEEQNVSMQDEGDKLKEQDIVQVPIESEEGENSDDSGNINIPEEPETPTTEWKIGWNFYEGNWYYAKEENTLYFGWIYLKSKWYYLDRDNSGIMACDEMKEISGCYYAFDANGEMQTGWILRPEGWYYANSSGALISGWMNSRGTWYYLDASNETNPMIMKSNGFFYIDGKVYYFDNNGAMRMKWIKCPEGWYYAGNDGAILNGWQRIGNAWYYLDESNEEYPGLMVSSCSKKIGGNTYIFTSSGAMLTGWDYSGTDWYYYDASGLIASGWRAVKGNWYYLDPSDNNKMAKCGWKMIGNKWYYFYSSGAMATNWLALNGEWYWLSDDGSMKTGWQIVGNAWYYMYTKNDVHGGSEGVMAVNTVIDGYVVHEDGAYIRSRNKLGWQNPAGYPQVSSLTVMLPLYCTGYFTYVTPSRISIYASRQECVDAFIERAYEYLGTRYIEPWSSYPGDAVDCSGFVLQCLYATGMDLGIYNPYNHRWIASQTYNSMNWYNNNTFMPVSTNSLQRGDLVYYRGHVAIYLGNGQIIDSWPGQGVSVKPIGSRGKVIGAARPYV